MNKEVGPTNPVPSVWFDELPILDEQSTNKPVKNDSSEIRGNQVSPIALRDIWCKQLAQREEKIAYPGELAQRFTCLIASENHPEKGKTQ
jgi:hypothetical protein